MMLFLYNLIVRIAGFLLKITALFSLKIKLFVEGRKVAVLERLVRLF